MLRRIKAATITTIALCRRGKNGMKTLLKADGSAQFEALVKSTGNDELLSVVYAPERPDDDTDYADATVIKAFAHEYLRDHRLLDIEHDGKPLNKSQAYVAESFIIAKGDERFRDWKNYDGQPVGDLTGAWATVIKLTDPALQKAYRDGDLDGVSMFGRAALEHVDPKAASQRVADSLGKARENQGNDMNKEELMAALGGFKAELVALVKSTVADAIKPAEPKAPETPELQAPVFKGSVSNPEDLAAFESELRTFELQKALAAGSLTADKISEMRKALVDGEASDAEVGIESTDTPKEKSLKRELFKARKARNAPERKGDETNEVTLAKANEDEGKAIAALVNSRNGSGAPSMRIVDKG